MSDMTKEEKKPQDGAIRRVTITVHDSDPSHDRVIASTDHFPANRLPALKQEADQHNADPSRRNR